MSDETTDLIDTDEPSAEPQLIEWDGETLDASEALRERGATYGEYVNTGRAIPDIRDGMKPVQRRVIYAMADKNQVFSRGTTKSARIVGEVMGKLHPHGDSSIYEALVRMGQSFTVNTPLIHGQGNFGSADGDPAAAMRYSEAKLSQASSEWRADLRPEIVPFTPNFDESTTEASVLPVTFPNLLVNGSSGIGWSLAVDVPPHNLSETIDAALLIATNPSATLKQVLKKLPGPDYPSKGIIVNPDVLEEAYATGSGTFLLQGRYHVETGAGGQQQVVITELPHQVGPSQIFEEIVAAAKADKLSEIATGASDKPVNLSNKSGIKLIVKCKRGGNVQALIAQLLKYTALQKTQKMNFTVLRDGTPASVTLLDILIAFNDFRHEVVTKRLEYEKSVLLRDLHRLTAIRAALDVIDEVIKIIRSSKDDDQAREKLMKLVKVTPYGSRKAVPIDREQAQFIMDTQLKRLSRLNRLSLDEEIKTKADRVAEIDVILADPAKITEIVCNELKDIKKRFGAERNTVMSGEGAVTAAAGVGGKAPVAAAIPKTDVSVFVTRTGMAVAVERSGKARKAAPITVSSGDSVISVFDCDTEQSVDVFTAYGKTYRVRVAELGIEVKKNKGRAICALEKGDEVIGVLLTDAQPFLTVVTAGGQAKRMPSEIFKNNYSGGMDAIGLTDDQAMAVIGAGEDEELLVHTAQGKVLRTAMAGLTPKKTPSAGGMALIKLAAGDKIVSAVAVPALGSDEGKALRLLVVHETGQAKAVALEEYPLKGRGGGGVQSVATDKPAKDPAGDVVVAAPVPASGDLTVLSAAGQVVFMDASKLHEGARGPVASKAWVEFGPGDPAALIFAG